MPHIRQCLPLMRLTLQIASLLVLSIGLSLYLLSEQTDRYFAWTIQSPLTAAFLGASYLSAFVLQQQAARQPDWANARVAVPAVLVFTALTLLVTLLHLDRFHFSAPLLLTRLGTWVWLMVYLLVPPLLLVVWFWQERVAGVDPPPTRPLAAWVRNALWVLAAIQLMVGIGLLLVPLSVAPFWPWTLTALTGQAIGAWLIGLGIAAGHSAWEGDGLRARPIFLGAVTFVVLQLIAVARYAAELRWAAASTWVYLLCLVAFLVLGIVGIRQRGKAELPNPTAGAGRGAP